MTKGRKKKKIKRRKSKSKKGMSVGNILKQPKFLVPVLIIVVILFAYSGGFTAFSAFGGEGWSFEVKYSSVEIDGSIPAPNGVIVSTNVDGVRIDADYRQENVEGGATLSPEGTGYSPIHIGTGTWRSIYLVDGREYITDVGEGGLPYSETFEGNEAVRTYQLLMQVLVMTELEYDAVGTSSTLQLLGGLTSSTSIPAIQRQSVEIEFNTISTWLEDNFAGAFSLLAIEKSGVVDGIVKSETVTGGITTIPISGYAEIYGDEPYENPIIPTINDIQLTPGTDNFEFRFIVAPGVVRHDGEWRARNIELTFDLKFTVEARADEFSAARLNLPAGVASPVGGFNLFASWLPALGVEQMIIILVVGSLFIFIIIYWKVRSWRGRKGFSPRDTGRVRRPKGILADLGLGVPKSYGGRGDMEEWHTPGRDKSGGKFGKVDDYDVD